MCYTINRDLLGLVDVLFVDLLLLIVLLIYGLMFGVSKAILASTLINQLRSQLHAMGVFVYLLLFIVIRGAAAVLPNQKIGFV